MPRKTIYSLIEKKDSKMSRFQVPRIRQQNSAEKFLELRESSYEPPFQILNITHKVTNDVAIVELLVRIQNDEYVISGESRRAKGDDVNRDTGYFIALNRAFRNLNSKIARRAEGMVQHGDNMQAYKETQKSMKKLDKYYPDAPSGAKIQLTQEFLDHLKEKRNQVASS